MTVRIHNEHLLWFFSLPLSPKEYYLYFILNYCEQAISVDG